MLEVWIDGACEPVNPRGTASYGVVIQTSGARIHMQSIVGSGDGMSNNVGEYSGLIAFLEWYLANADGQLTTVMSDSKMLIYQMKGWWAIRGGLYVPYYNKAQELMGKVKFREVIGFEWIPREQNWEADNLSKQALIAIGIKPRH